MRKFMADIVGIWNTAKYIERKFNKRLRNCQGVSQKAWGSETSGKLLSEIGDIDVQTEQTYILA